MDFKPRLSMLINDKVFDYKFFETLEAIGTYWSQRQAAKELGIAHTVLNRRIKEGEEYLGVSLVKISGKGSVLTDEAHGLLKQYYHYYLRMEESSDIVIYGGFIVSELLEFLAEKGGFDVSVYRSSDIDSYDAVKHELADILGLDDPVIAFQEDLDFEPIAYDHLVLVSQENRPISNLGDLDGCDFISVSGSSQRLAWNILNDHGIDFNIVDSVNSPYEAYRIVKQDPGLYSFLNASFFRGDDILRNETRHTISIVNFRESDSRVAGFLKYVRDECDDLIKSKGFVPLY